jgi:hypothetical protein
MPVPAYFMLTSELMDDDMMSSKDSSIKNCPLRHERDEFLENGLGVRNIVYLVSSEDDEIRFLGVE